MAPGIPDNIDELTTDWLTAALRVSRVIDAATRVVSMSIEPLGEGTGFAGVLARLTISYADGHGPASVVAKLPTPNPETRGGMELLGLYEREIMAYQTLIADLPVPVAELIHADIDPNPNAATQLDNIGKVERLPLWVLRRLSRLMLHSSAAKPRPSVLLVQDLAPAHIGDQVIGCDRSTAESVVDVAARLHAATWDTLAPEPTYWLLPGDLAPKLFQAGFLDTRRALLRRGAARLGEHSLAMIQTVRHDGRRIIERIHQNSPRCLCHGDLRLDNIFFASDGTVRALIDWQLTYLGPGVIDLAYFITSSLPAESPEAEVDHLIAFYHEQLTSAGVEGYPLDRLRADYDDALLVVLQRMAGVDNIDFGDGRGIDLVDIWIERLDARLRRVAA